MTSLFGILAGCFQIGPTLHGEPCFGVSRMSHNSLWRMRSAGAIGGCLALLLIIWWLNRPTAEMGSDGNFEASQRQSRTSVGAALETTPVDGACCCC